MTGQFQKLRHSIACTDNATLLTRRLEVMNTTSQTSEDFDDMADTHQIRQIILVADEASLGEGRDDLE